MGNDRLFRSSYENCKGNDCFQCGPEQGITRERRERPEDPEINYGIIAFGNTLVKDSVAREESFRHIPHECICYKMDATSIMNDFPFLVIRGIYDYADAHNNDHWQYYTAVTAAAFAKQLLVT